MFCLRSWIPILFFLTNASPIYLILFISATYVFNRPCVYCSLLLAVLVISLFDFHSNWFEPRYMHPSQFGQGNDTMSNLPSGILESLSYLTAAMNSTAANMVESLVGNIKSRTPSDVHVNSAAAEWVRSMLRKEWKLSCFDVVLRL